MKINNEVHVTKNGILKRNSGSKLKLIKDKVFDWKESDEANKFIEQHYNNYSIFQFDIGDDAILLCLLPKGTNIADAEEFLLNFYDVSPGDAPTVEVKKVGLNEY